jgi:outer membrane protein insertion porin family
MSGKMRGDQPFARNGARVPIKVVLAVGLLLVCGPGRSLGAAPVNASPKVVRVEIRSNALTISVEELRRSLAMEVGDPYTPAAVARSLRNLQASRVAGEIEAFAEPVADGVAVTFALWASVQVRSVQVAGELGLKPEQLRRGLEQRPAAPLLESQVLRDVYHLQDLLEDQGFLERSVRPEVEIDEQSMLADITYRVDSGRPFRVASVRFEGSIGLFSEDDLLDVLKAKAGKRFRRSTALSDVERLEGWLFDNSFRQARVENPVVTVERESAEVHLVYRIEPGPRFDIEIVGSEVKRLRKKGLLPFMERQRYDEALLLQSVDRIRAHYQQQGHYQVVVDTEEAVTTDVHSLRLTTAPGPVFELTEVRFEGNEEVSEEQLVVLMNTSPRRLLAAGSGRLVDAVLRDDLANIYSFYLLQGYSQAHVGPQEIDIDGDKIAVTIPISEGPQQRVVILALEGAQYLAGDDLTQGLPLQPGGPFHPRLLEDTVNGILARYEQKGFESAQISYALEWNEEQTLVDIRLRVLEGPRSVVDRVIVRGTSKTQPRIVRRAMRLEPGQFINTSRLLEVQRNLYQLGTFSHIEVRKAPGTPFRGERDVLVDVEEGKRRKLTYGFGFNSEDGLNGLFGYSVGNLLGRALAARVDLRGSRNDKVARFLLTQPYFWRWRLPSTFSLFFIEEVRDSFTSRRQGSQFEIQRLGDHSQLALLFDFRIVELLEVEDPLGELEIDRDLQEVEIASITPAWLLDHRNDLVNPSEGWSTAVQVEYAFPFAVADAEFLKLFNQETGYLNFGRYGFLAGSFRLGAIEPLTTVVEDPTIPGDLESRLVPISERFFAGGRTTHRAYRRDRLGIPGQTLLPKGDLRVADADADDLVAVGGNGLLIANVDYRFPIAGPVGGSVFADFGNVWADWREIDPGEGKLGVGLGARYLSPIGPVRLEAGWKLDPLAGEDDYVILFSFGNPY